MVGWLGTLPQPAVAQYRLDSPTGDTLHFTAGALKAMLDTTRSLYSNLQLDPHVMYYTDVGRAVTETSPKRAYPWNAVVVRNDSVAVIVTPGNLREANRAYYNYAVLRMQAVRTGDPDVSCDSLAHVERRIVSAFIDGWIVTRTLFGGPSYSALDELTFARERGVLMGLLAVRKDSKLGACVDRWAAEHPAEVEAYRAWVRSEVPPGGAPATVAAAHEREELSAAAARPAAGVEDSTGASGP